MTCRPAVDARLRARRRLLDAPLGQALLDRLGHAAEGLDLGDVLRSLLASSCGEALDERAAAPRIDVASCRSRAAGSSWVLRAMRALASVGSAIASSSELVWSDWVCPLRGGHRLEAVRTTLL
jgi:hypothetical protein